MTAENKRGIEELAAETKAYGDLLKAVQKIEEDKNVEAVAGLLGLSAEEQRHTQARLEAEAKGADQLTKADADLKDARMKASLDTTAYQIAKIQEHLAAQKAGYTGLEALRGAYDAAVTAKAQMELDALAAAAAKTADATAAKAQASLQAVLTAMTQSWQQYQAALDAANPTSFGTRPVPLGPMVGSPGAGTGRYPWQSLKLEAMRRVFGRQFERRLRTLDQKRQAAA